MAKGPIEPVEHTIISDGRPRLFYFGTDQRAYELDEGESPQDPREVAILRALIKVSNPKTPGHPGFLNWCRTVNTLKWRLRA